MKKILVVDDMLIFREAIAAALKGAGYLTTSASNGAEAIKSIIQDKPDLVLLDVGMPVMDGIATLSVLRSNPDTHDLPIILLTALSDRDKVIQAAKYGIQDYLLKSRFSLTELTERVKLRLSASTSGSANKDPSPSPLPSPALPIASPPPPVPPSTPVPGSTPRAVNNPASSTLLHDGSVLIPPFQSLASASAPPSAAAQPSSSGTIPHLLTRTACLARVAKVMEGRTLSGVVSEVISTAMSPRMDITQLATLISRDPALSAKVLRVANSPIYASRSGPKTTITEAVRTIGASTVRNITAAMSVFDAMPASSLDGFNPIRHWQHSFAVAKLCEYLAAQMDEEHASTAYLVGLCHDLAQIMYRVEFANEYAQVLQWEARTRKDRMEIEKSMLGIEHQELVTSILRQLGLPDSIYRPIAAFHNNKHMLRASEQTWLVQLLQVAEYYANGLMVAAGKDSQISPLTTAQCIAATGQDHLLPPDTLSLRNEVLSMSAMLARLPAREEARILAPIYPGSSKRVCLVREASLSSFDPVEEAVENLANTTRTDRIPSVELLRLINNLVIVTENQSTTSTFTDELNQLRSRNNDLNFDVLWLIPDNGHQYPLTGDKVLTWPLSLEKLATSLGIPGETDTTTRNVSASAA